MRTPDPEQTVNNLKAAPGSTTKLTRISVHELVAKANAKNDRGKRARSATKSLSVNSQGEKRLKRITNMVALLVAPLMV